MKEKKDIKVAGNSEAERRREEEAYNRGEEVGKGREKQNKGIFAFWGFFSYIGTVSISPTAPLMGTKF